MKVITLLRMVSLCMAYYNYWQGLYSKASLSHLYLEKYTSILLLQKQLKTQQMYQIRMQKLPKHTKMRIAERRKNVNENKTSALTAKVRGI